MIELLLALIPYVQEGALSASCINPFVIVSPGLLHLEFCANALFKQQVIL